ncbi:hypothetical protein FN976_25455 [Caenimonas sedimenti]|uniref:Lipoprotein n=1 Tax=Caenimonas sedimenti TaxID=2596921 RepID=A0A562ZGP4_9BURK|nr:hypothetical protein [Caenimonas sedimenti]TWO67740.1 hypothetical protein FN976_25455 [Caenimonas sedimenti]
MQTLIRASCLAFTVLLTACGGGGGDPFAETVKLHTGQPKTIDGGQLTLTMTKFIDSRCPKTVTCITAGSSVIDVTLAQQGATPVSVQMTLSGATGTALPVYTYGPYRIEYTDMTPYPDSPVLSITDSEATLVVRRD